MRLKKILFFLVKYYRYLVIIYFIIQLIYISVLPITFESDSLRYFNLAQECIKNHTFYPTSVHLFNDYIIAPLYINLLIIVLSIYNSVFTIGLLNILLNFLQMLLIYKITYKLFGNEPAKISVIIYVFYLSTLGLILFNFTEFFFCVLLLSSIYFYIKGTKSSFILSGIFIAASIAVRPIGWALVLAYVVIYFIDIFNSKSVYKAKSLLFTGLVIFLFIFGTLTYLNSGRFIFTSTNGPVNLIIGANDDATGAYNDRVFHKGHIGYISDAEAKSYYEKEKYWKEKAINWITENPIRWLSLFPLKLVHIFIWDDFTVSRLLNLRDWNLYKAAKTFFIIKRPQEVLKGKTLLLKLSFFSLLLVHHVYYYLILILFLFFITKNFKKLWNINYNKIFMLFIFFGLLIHLITFGGARFKYPFILIMMIMLSKKIYQSLTFNKNPLKYK